MAHVSESAAPAADSLAQQRFGSFPEASRAVLELLERRLPGSAVFMGHLDHAGERFWIVDSGGDESFELEAGTTIPIGDSFCLNMAEGRAPALCNRVAAEPAYANLEPRDRLGIASYVGVPLRAAEGESVGSLCAIARDENAYSDEDLDLLRVLGSLLAYELEREAQRREIERLSAVLQEQARTDTLTGLLNRRAFDEALEREWQLARRERSASLLLYFDVDEFKTVNDTQGHAAGDELLVAVASALSSAARRTDIVARVGGDEFAAILVRAEPTRSGGQFAERIRAILASRGVSTTVSVGEANLGLCRSTAEALAAADAAMYAAKRERL